MCTQTRFQPHQIVCTRARYTATVWTYTAVTPTRQNSRCVLAPAAPATYTRSAWCLVSTYSKTSSKSFWLKSVSFRHCGLKIWGCACSQEPPLAWSELAALADWWPRTVSSHRSTLSSWWEQNKDPRLLLLSQVLRKSSQCLLVLLSSFAQMADQCYAPCNWQPCEPQDALLAWCLTRILLSFFLLNLHISSQSHTSCTHNTPSLITIFTHHTPKIALFFSKVILLARATGKSYDGVKHTCRSAFRRSTSWCGWYASIDYREFGRAVLTLTKRDGTHNARCYVWFENTGRKPVKFYARKPCTSHTFLYPRRAPNDLLKFFEIMKKCKPMCVMMW